MALSTHLSRFTERFSSVFNSHHNAQEGLEKQYVSGLFQAHKNNIERMVEKVVNSDYENLQHFISDSPWSFRSLIDQVAEQSSNLFTSYSVEVNLPTGLYLDESSFKKKGRHSVGVGRQYLGSTGKVDNGQVAVFSSLGCGTYCTPVDCRLYLPKSWTADSDRCDRVGIPHDHRQYKTKLELALESIDHLHSMDIAFDFIAFDALYGSSLAFVKAIDASGHLFVGRIRNNLDIYLNKPEFNLPEYSGRGRYPTKLKTDEPCFSPKEITATLNEQAWKSINVRTTTKGLLTVDAVLMNSWLHDGSEIEPTHIKLLIIREKSESGKYIYTYSLSNASDKLSLEEIVKMDRQRYWIERSFQDCKMDIGMGQYQVRKYLGFYHHMALCMLASLFLNTMRISYKEQIPLLSCRDIALFLEFLLEDKAKTAMELYLQMVKRHTQRLSAINSATRARNKSPTS